MKFTTEAEMSQGLRSSFAAFPVPKNISWVDELEGVFGIPDYVVFKVEPSRVSYVVSLELKLRDWQRGLVQAFRYRNFSNESYLVLDEANIRPALRNLRMFERSNIGLASFSLSGEFKLHFAPTPSLPFSSRSSAKAIESFIARAGSLSPDHSTTPAKVFIKSTLGRFTIPPIIPLHSVPISFPCEKLSCRRIRIESSLGSTQAHNEQSYPLYSLTSLL